MAALCSRRTRKRSPASSIHTSNIKVLTKQAPNGEPESYVLTLSVPSVIDMSSWTVTARELLAVGGSDETGLRQGTKKAHQTRKPRKWTLRQALSKKLSLRTKTSRLRSRRRRSGPVATPPPSADWTLRRQAAAGPCLQAYRPTSSNGTPVLSTETVGMQCTSRPQREAKPRTLHSVGGSLTWSISNSVFQLANTRHAQAQPPHQACEIIPLPVRAAKAVIGCTTRPVKHAKAAKATCLSI